MCKIYTEKNEGCNHMTCTNCKYQWCWLCEGQYSYGHYDSGTCRGYQFTKADNLEEAKKKEVTFNYSNYNFNYNFNRGNAPNCCFTLHSIFPCCIHEVNRFYLNRVCKRYFFIFLKIPDNDVKSL